MAIVSHKHVWFFVPGCEGHGDNEACFCDSAHFECSEKLSKPKKHRCTERLDMWEVESILNEKDHK